MRMLIGSGGPTLPVWRWMVHLVRPLHCRLTLRLESHRLVQLILVHQRVLLKRTSRSVMPPHWTTSLERPVPKCEFASRLLAKIKILQDKYSAPREGKRTLPAGRKREPALRMISGAKINENVSARKRVTAQTSGTMISGAWISGLKRSRRSSASQGRPSRWL